MSSGRFKFMVRVVVSALTAFLVLTGSQVLFAKEKYPFEDSLVSGSLGYVNTKLQYHSHMNAYFNEKIKSMLKMKTDDPNYGPPEGEEECSDDNVSTYCVAMGALDRYYKYADILNDMRGAAVIANYVTDFKAYSISDILGITGMLSDAIVREIQSALETMELTISAYNELRLAYPMHKKYEALLIDLNSYKDMILDIESRAEWLPSKYIGATSKKGCD